MKSALAKFQPENPKTRGEILGMAKAAWHLRNVITIPLDDPAIILSQMDRAYLEAIGNKIYGERNVPRETN